jgi:glucosamine kinase
VRHVGPGANLQRDGLETTASRLATLVRQALADLPQGRPLRLCAGVAGAGHPTEQAALAEALRQQLGRPSREDTFTVVPDGLIALEGAFPDGRSGLLASLGTGSVFLARTEAGEVLRAGGWGARLGDPGSATEIGRAALIAVADAFDGGEPTVLRARLAQDLGLDSPEAFRLYVNGPDYAPATLAALVVEAAAVPDWAATRILQCQANAVARRVAWLATRAAEKGELAPRLALVGGLTAASLYREIVEEAVLRHLPHWRLVRAAIKPEEAALARITPATPYTRLSGG